MVWVLKKLLLLIKAIQNIQIDDLKTAAEFISQLQGATLDASRLSPSMIQRLRNCPPESSSGLDQTTRFSIKLFIATLNSSQQTYESVRGAILEQYPEDNILSYHEVKKAIEELTGVTSVVHDMCYDTCIAFTGPFSTLEHCPSCRKPRYKEQRQGSSTRHPKVPNHVFHTIPLGPQIQALWSSPDGVEDMLYSLRHGESVRDRLSKNNGTTPFYDDFYSGTDYLAAVSEEKIKNGDTILLFSLDGAQLYEHKQSDCWIYIWVILNLSPDKRYKKKHVLPGAFIPGPNKPKNIDSFLFPGLYFICGVKTSVLCLIGLYHLCALQKEGLSVWNPILKELFKDHPFLALVTADGPAMAYLNGLVGHNGAFGCRLYCPVKGRRKDGGTHYYPALLKPSNYTVEGCTHDTISPSQIPLSSSSTAYQRNLQIVMSSPTDTAYGFNRKNTGISKPSIFSGLPSAKILGIPGCFGHDLMHLVSLNLTDLFYSLWRGKITCEKTDDILTWDWATFLNQECWEVHGKRVANCRPYLPGSFDRPPRNPAEKISSGYKAWEFLMWMFGLGPALFFHVLDEKYWKNFCKLTRAIHLLHQRSISLNDLFESHTLIMDFIPEFEQLYYQGRADRLHFVRPCIHTLLHLPGEVHHLGPSIIYTQWTMERTIRNLGKKVKQPSQPYANISQRGVLRCQINAILAMFPSISPISSSPSGSISLSSGHILLGAKDKNPQTLSLHLSQLIQHALTAAGTNLTTSQIIKLVRWARLKLPNGQIARSLWKEKEKHPDRLHIARNIKVSLLLYFQNGLIVTTMDLVSSWNH